MNNTQKSIDRVCEYRGIPRVQKGALCTVDGKKGHIVGGNSSANFSVRFEGSNHTTNCHPYWKMKIFTQSGDVYYDHEAEESERKYVALRLKANGININELE